MTSRLTIRRLLVPAECVVFDHNPEKLTVSRQQAKDGKGPGSADTSPQAGLTTGSLGAMFHGTDPMTMTISKARVVGPTCKLEVDALMGWMSPASGMVSAGVNLVLGKLGITPTKPPDLVVEWGPPAMGFTMVATLTRATANYVRVTSEGVPLVAECDLVLLESSSPLSMTNPTSGGRPGRNRRTVHADESLASIADEAFGNPSAWRAIAEVNGIDDPASVRPGDVVYLPAPDELGELREARL